MAKKLKRSTSDTVISGVCGGIGTYLDVDPVLVRIVLMLFTLLGVAGLLFYLVCWICMPADTDSQV